MPQAHGLVGGLAGEGFLAEGVDGGVRGAEGSKREGHFTEAAGDDAEGVAVALQAGGEVQGQREGVAGEIDAQIASIGS